MIGSAQSTLLYYAKRGVGYEIIEESKAGPELKRMQAKNVLKRSLLDFEKSDLLWLTDLTGYFILDMMRKQKGRYCNNLMIKYCRFLVIGIELVNINWKNKRATRLFKILVSSKIKGPWVEALGETELEDGRKQSNPLPIQEFLFSSILETRFSGVCQSRSLKYANVFPNICIFINSYLMRSFFFSKK